MTISWAFVHQLSCGLAMILTFVFYSDEMTVDEIRLTKIKSGWRRKTQLANTSYPKNSYVRFLLLRERFLTNFIIDFTLKQICRKVKKYLFWVIQSRAFQIFTQNFKILKIKTPKMVFKVQKFKLWCFHHNFIDALYFFLIFFSNTVF